MITMAGDCDGMIMIQPLANEASPWPELFDSLTTRVGLLLEYG